jgi:DNA-binding transcriptional LysR family regulator
MDRIESMSAFVAVAKAAGFSAAARQIGIPLATISRRVADLESALGVRLLHRSTRQVVLTEVGQNFFATCQRLLEDLKDAEEAVTGEFRSPKGEVTVTAPMGFGRLHLQSVAMDFLAAYPEINLRLLLIDRVVDLVDEHVDVALRIAELPDSRLIARPLGNIRVVVSAAPKYLARRGIPKHPSELMRHDCIAWSTLGLLNTWWFKGGGKERTFPIRTRLTTTSADSAIAAAQSGLGLVQTTSYQAEQGVRDGNLVVALQEFECAATPVSLVYVSNRLLPLKLRAFLDFVAPRLSERLKSITSAFTRGGPKPAKASRSQPPSRNMQGRKRRRTTTGR